MCRYDYQGAGPYIPVGYSIGSVFLHFGAQPAETVKTFAVAGNFYEGSWSRLPMACTVHEFRGKGGYVAFHMEPYGTGGLILLDNVGLFLLAQSTKLDSSAYMHDIVVTRAQPPPWDSLYTVTYRGIPLRGHNTLLVHLAPTLAARAPLAFYVNDSAVAGVNEPFVGNDEFSFGWRPGTDSASVTFWGVRDSIVFSAQELTIFTLDLDTAADPRPSAIRTGRLPGTAKPAPAVDHLGVFDVRGRRVQSHGSPSGSAFGVYLRTESVQGCVRPVVAGTKR